MKLHSSIAIMAFGALLLGTTPVQASQPAKATTEKARCKATTKQGTRCKNKVVSGKNYCTVHLNKKTVQCKAKTQKGTRCTRTAVTSGGYCKQHSKK